ncbi:MAG: hypothetical protein CENE_03685 [Candidatus Celerinatantimonas neptuna]|nr:MAG: hypothetical protein CENE_03685 [Candidatus Celerinatantimonas neptuna]
MLPESIRQSVCCDELQLGQALNQCVEQGQHAKFSLLLSLLSSDITDQPQFEFNQSEPEKCPINWRAYFQLPKEVEVYSSAQDLEPLPRWNHLARQGYMATIHLEQQLNRPPLCATKEVLTDEILNNLSLLDRLKYERQQRPDDFAEKIIDEEIKSAAMVNVLNDFDYQKPIKLHPHS